MDVSEYFVREWSRSRSPSAGTVEAAKKAEEEADNQAMKRRKMQEAAKAKLDEAWEKLKQDEAEER